MKSILRILVIALIFLNGGALLLQAAGAISAQQSNPSGAVYSNGQMVPQSSTPTPGQMKGIPGKMQPPGMQGTTQTQGQQLNTTPIPGKIPIKIGQKPTGSPTPGQMPGIPGKQQSGDWNLSELLYGIMQIDATKDKLTKAQALKILPALTRVVEATRLITDTETILQKTLTKEQMAYLKDAQSRNALKLNVILPMGKPGQDPLVGYVLTLLEKKAK